MVRSCKKASVQTTLDSITSSDQSLATRSHWTCIAASKHHSPSRPHSALQAVVYHGLKSNIGPPPSVPDRRPDSDINEDCIQTVSTKPIDGDRAAVWSAWGPPWPVSPVDWLMILRIIIITSCRWEAAKIFPRPLWPRPFELESGVRATCDVGYLCVNFSLPRPLCSRLRPDVHVRQTYVRQTSDSIIA